MCIQNLICSICGGVALLLLGCFATIGGETADAIGQDAPAVSVELLLTGDDSKIFEAGQHLIASKDDWAALWARHLGPDVLDPESGEVSHAAPEVDFDTQLVVAVFVGRGTSYGLKLVSHTTEDDQFTIRYYDRSYQTTMGGPLDNEEAMAEWEERYGHISAYGFFLISRSEREIVLVQQMRRMGSDEVRLVERARVSPPVP